MAHATSPDSGTTTEPDAFDALQAALDDVADAVTHVAVQRNKITAKKVIQETCTNVTLLARIPAVAYGTADDRARVDAAVAELVAALRALPAPRRVR
ncbi:hypothetical protein [Glycomyces sp. YM15]|uniref:hypothetical protein n=1 Tax=Glycomyces sp. YM15 TaxID=2800446 RepID=UPI001963CEE9|nr:hypothetical protein [Glycomyces sp. YM15]